VRELEDTATPVLQTPANKLWSVRPIARGQATPAWPASMPRRCIGCGAGASATTGSGPVRPGGIGGRAGVD